MKRLSRFASAKVAGLLQLHGGGCVAFCERKAKLDALCRTEVPVEAHVVAGGVDLKRDIGVEVDLQQLVAQPSRRGAPLCIARVGRFRALRARLPVPLRRRELSHHELNKTGPLSVRALLCREPAS